MECTKRHNGRVDHDTGYDEWGIAHGYHDVHGNWHDTPAATREHLRAAMGQPPHAEPLWFVEHGQVHGLQGRCHLTLHDGSDWGEHDWLPDDVPLGYHRLAPLDGGPVTTLVVAPRACRPAPYGWGVAAQVYSLWRPDGWGIGDLRDVERLGQQVAARGGNTLLLSPLHAPSPSLPQETSPYYPSSRRWLNPLLIPLDGTSPVANVAGGLIDRSAVWPAKRQALFDRFLVAADQTEWRTWAAGQGDDLQLFCTWNALSERLGARWAEWPEPLRHPSSPTIAALAHDDPQFAPTRDFHAWLQWVANSAVQATSAHSGVGLVGDLAVGCSPDGADAWLYQDLMALDVRIGAPPDPFNAAGQNWGLPPFVPGQLHAAGYRPFIGMARAACQHMAGLRIDHVMGLFRQFWIPEGGTPADGAYVQLPANELLAIVRLEATLAGAFVVGEDLGTVEPRVRDALRDSNILGTKVWWFDQHQQEWPAANLATVTTHDLPTVVGVWNGTDGTPEMGEQLRWAVSATVAADASAQLHAQVATSAAQLCLAAIDDVAGCADRPNHPGTLGDEHPNWCRRMPADSLAILTGDPGAAIVDAVRAARPPRPDEATETSTGRTAPPFLETDRLVLRRFTDDDVDDLLALDLDPLVRRFVEDGEPVNRDEAADTVRHFQGYYERGEVFGFWVAEEKATGAFLGWFHFRPLPDAPSDEPELGYRLVADAWNKGYGTEGSRALIDMGFRTPHVQRVVAETMAAHGASRRVMEKAGMRLVRSFPTVWPVRIPGDEEGDVQYAITRAEWETLTGFRNS